MDPTPRSSNGLLASLSADDFELIRPHLRVIRLFQEQVLLEAADPIKQVYFPHSGVVSLVVNLDKGEPVEVAMVGRDSVLGAFATLGEAISLVDVVVLIPGTASMLEVEHLRSAADRSAQLRKTLVKHQQALFVQAQQTAGCNAAHPVEARLARWLLRARDLSGSSSFMPTQELMAQMIGARRNSVSIVAHTCRKPISFATAGDISRSSISMPSPRHRASATERSRRSMRGCWVRAGRREVSQKTAVASLHARLVPPWIRPIATG
jgi:CRP-like cAMP-binding protein